MDKAERLAIASVAQGCSPKQLCREVEAELLKPEPDLSCFIGLFIDWFHGRGATKHFSQHQLKFVTSDPLDQHAQKKICKLAAWRLMEIDDIHKLYSHISCLLTFLDTPSFELQGPLQQLDPSVWVPMRIRQVVCGDASISDAASRSGVLYSWPG